jgi:hypothetical protein
MNRSSTDEERNAMAFRNFVRVALVLAVVGVHVLTASAAGAAAPATPTATHKQKRLAKQSDLKEGVKWLTTLQDASGGFGTFEGGSPDAGTTALVVSTLIALHNVGVAVETDEAVAYLKQTNLTELGEYNAYDWLAEIAIAFVGAGVDPRDVDGVDLIALLTDSWDATTGIYGGYLVLSAVIIMALTVADEPIEDQAFETIVSAQLDDGSWAFDGSTEPGSGSTVTTSFCIQALVAAGRGDDETIDDALAYFRSVQSDNGTFSEVAGAASSGPNAISTGYVISALIAVGENPKAKSWGDPVSGLLAWQNESGAFRNNDELLADDVTSTIAALIALSGAYWPVLPVT